MGDMNLGQYKTETLAIVDDMPATHRFATNGMLLRAINNAPNRLIRMNPDMFPEHLNQTWSVGPTVATFNYIALPGNVFSIDRVRHSGGAAIDPGNALLSWAAISEQVVSPVTVDTVGLLSKPSTIVQYPLLWDRKGANLLYYPTTQVTKTTTFRIYGTSCESPLTADGDTFQMDRQWDDLIPMVAAQDLFSKLGNPDRAAALQADIERRMGSTVNPKGRERAARMIQFSIAGMPR